MAAHKTPQNPHQWPNGEWHSIPWAQEVQHRNAGQGTVAIGNTPVTQAQWGNGALANALVPGSYPPVPSAPPVAAPPTWQPDSSYNNDVDLNQHAHDTTISQIGTDEGKVKFDFGFDDPTNPYSRQAEQKRITLAAGNRSNTSMANVGQLTTGAYQRALIRNRQNGEKAMQALRAQYDAALEDLNRKRTAADTTLNVGNSDAMKAAIARSTGN